ncbi:hypothetical protein [Maritalea sp.]|jgi:hypothetical protein|uniref:hypothetical protein n=1 Tax=Maritalea sp. TaxID=2003361 RepID=UPI0039E446A8
MITVHPPQIELSQTEQRLLDQIWMDEEQLARVKVRPPEFADQYSPDFVSFDPDGNQLEKTQFVTRTIERTVTKLKRLWGHFGSKNSCCLAYICEYDRGQTDICMALWIERDGAWRKAFHHENANFG